MGKVIRGLFNISVSLLCCFFVLTAGLRLDSYAKSDSEDKSNVIRVGWYESKNFQEGMTDSDIKSGYSYEYLQRISDYTGWEYKYVYGEWNDLYEMLIKGEIDMLAGVSETEERRDYMLFPDNIMGTDSYYLFQHSYNSFIDAAKPESFKNKKIGVVKNNRMTYFLEQWLEKNHIEAQLVYFDGLSDRDEAFADSTIDAMVGTDNNIKSNTGYSPVVRVGEEPFYLAVNKARPDILKELDSVLDTLIRINPNYLDALQIKCYGTTLSNSTLTPEEESWLRSRRTLHVGYIYDYMPFCGTDEDGNVTGLVTDVVSGIVKVMGMANLVEIEYVGFNSFKEMSESVVAGTIDFSFPVIGERQYLSEMNISGTFDILTVPFNVAYKGTYSDETFNVISLNSRPIKVITEGYPNSEILSVGSASECLDAILSGDATCTVMSSYRLKEILNNPKYSDIKTMPFSATTSYCIGVNKNSHELLSILNKGVSFVDESMLVDSAYRYIQNNSKYSFSQFVKDNLLLVGIIGICFFALAITCLALYLRSVNKSRQLLQRNFEKVNLLAALGRDYDAVYFGDLDNETLSVLYTSHVNSQFHMSKSWNYYEAVNYSLMNYVRDDAREDFKKFLNIDEMKRRMEREHSFSYKYPGIPNKEGKYFYEMVFVCASDDTSKHQLVVGTKCIDERLRQEREEGQYNEALLSECAYFYEFDVTEGMISGNFISNRGYSPLFNLQIDFPISYDEFNRIRAEKLGMKAMGNESKYWTCEGLRKAYSEGIKNVSVRYSSKQLSFHWNATIILTEDENRHHLHAVYICKDVTDLIENEIATQKQLEHALDLAETANQAKTMFLNNMSHDIRTPMNAIMGFANLMERDKDNPEVITDYIKKIRNSGDYLLSIINNVLDMARIESGKASVDLEVVNLEEAFADLMASMEPLFNQKNQIFTGENNYEHKYVLIDKSKHQQIVINLLSNANKYTPDGGVIKMNMEEIASDDPNRGIFKLTISDNGIGMSAEFVDHIFDSFARERNTTDSKVSGTGLGMSIVKKLVDLLGGEIEVKSEVGKGTTFIVTFTHQLVDSPEAYSKSNGDESTDYKLLCGKRILLAEDNDLNAEIAMAILEGVGISCERASDGVECVDMLTKADYDYYNLILMDVQMPNLNGYEATRRIRALPDSRYSSIPIVAMTANAFEEDRKEAYAAGMNAHLSKPIEIPKLIETLSQQMI